MGLNQFKRLNYFIKNRSLNKNIIIDQIKKDKRWNNQFSFVDIPKNVEPSYMVLPIFINKKFKDKKKKFINFIEKKGLETRPIISGSFVNQPSSKLYNLNPKNLKFKGAQEVEDLGFVIGLNTKQTKIKKIDYVVNTLFSIDIL